MPYLNLTANGTTSLNADYLKGYVEFDVKGTFGSGTVTISVVKGGEAYSRASFTEAGNIGLLLGTNKDVQVTLSGATAPDIDLHYQPIFNK